MKKLISSIAMVIGTTIGGGMIVLPAVVGVYSLYSAIGLLIIVWLVNTLIALIFLEANYYLPSQANLISLAKRLLGPWGAWIAWLTSLIFLFSILCAYLTGMMEIIGPFFESSIFSIPKIYLAIAIALMIAFPIYFGAKYISAVNNFIVIGMFITFFTLLIFLAFAMSIDNLFVTKIRFPIMSLPIVFTSFGFLIIVPSLRTYLNDQVRSLKISIIMGSLIPLIIYCLWITVVLCLIPKATLQLILVAPEPIKNLTRELIFATGNLEVSILIQLFIFLAITSSFIGTSLGLYDFLADGLKITKTKIGRIKLLILTFLPPIIFSLSQTHLFISALGFAGFLSALLFGLYPIFLTWSGRYIFKLSTIYRVSINRSVLILLMTFSLLVMYIEFLRLKA